MPTLRFRLIFVCLVLGLLALGNANELDNFVNDKGLPDRLKININQLLDNNIVTVRDVLDEFDPANLPDVPLWSKGQLTKGLLSVLSKVKRAGDCTLSYNDKVLSIDLRMGWDILKYDFDYAFKLWFIQRYGKVHGSVAELGVNMKIYVDLKNYVIVLAKFKFEHVGYLDLELEGTFGDTIRSFIARIIINLAKYNIMEAVEEIGSKLLREKIDKLNKRIPNEKIRFKFIDLVKMNRNTYAMSDYAKENY